MIDKFRDLKIYLNNFRTGLFLGKNNSILNTERIEIKEGRCSYDFLLFLAPAENSITAGIRIGPHKG